jgi:hypothetical protein
VLELADRRDLQSRAHSGHPSPILGWGITPINDRRDNGTTCSKKSKPKSKKGKPGPVEERLFIPDPQKAIDGLFKPKPKKKG